MFWLPVLLLVFDFEPDLKYKLVKIWKGAIKMRISHYRRDKNFQARDRNRGNEDN